MLKNGSDLSFALSIFKDLLFQGMINHFAEFLHCVCCLNIFNLKHSLHWICERYADHE